MVYQKKLLVFLYKKQGFTKTEAKWIQIVSPIIYLREGSPLSSLLKNKKIIVTGGAGFIGSHLAEELYRDNEVIVLDNLFTGKLENIRPFLEDKQGRVRFVQGSVTDLPLLLSVFQDADYVFHQAAITSVPRSVADPAATNETNIHGTLNVLLAARDTHVKKVVYASSSSVYGGNPNLP